MGRFFTGGYEPLDYRYYSTINLINSFQIKTKLIINYYIITNILIFILSLV
jgi:hypothetical protein